MASDEVSRERHSLKMKAISATTLKPANSIATDKYVCPDCGAKDAQVVVTGGVRDIGKAETWGSKDTPDEVVTVTCQVCKCKWQRGDFM